MIAWYLNRDKKWYKDMPNEEKHAYYHVQVGEEVMHIPRPFEWGVFFSALPEAMLNQWYEEDPKAVTDWVGHAIAMLSPLGTPQNPSLPVPAKIAYEQKANKVGYTGAPIIPRNQEEIPPGEQKGPYTSGLAVYMGKLFPNKVSPRRVDHAIRGFFGGLGSDMVSMVSNKEHVREKEPSDIPIIGTLFRRGGTHAIGSKSMEALYDARTQVKLDEYADIKNVVAPSFATKKYRASIKDAVDAVAYLRSVYHETPSRVARGRLVDAMKQIAEDAVALKGADPEKTIPFSIKLKTGPLREKAFKERDVKIDRLQDSADQ